MDFTSTDVLGQRVEFLSPQNSTLAQERDNSYDRLFDDPLKVETLNQRKSFIDTQENIPSCSESLIGICPIDHTNASNMIGCRSDVVVTNDYASLTFGGQETSMITDVSLPTESTKQDTWNSNGICNTRNTSIMDNSSLTVSGGRTYHSLETPESAASVSFNCNNSNSQVSPRNLQLILDGLSKQDVQNTAMDDQIILSLELNSDIDMMERSISTDCNSKLDDANSNGEDKNGTEQAISLVSNTRLHDKPFAMHNHQLPLNKKLGDQLVLVPLSMLSLKSSTLSFSDPAPGQVTQFPGQCNSIDHTSLNNKSIEIINDTNRNDIGPQNVKQINLKSTSNKNFNDTSISNQQNRENLRNNKLEHQSYPPISPPKNFKSSNGASNSISSNSLNQLNKLESRKRRNTSDHGCTTESNICQVCGEIAGKHNYYGGRSCPSCRAFFRRSVEIFAKDPDYLPPCTCVQGCRAKNKAICIMNKDTRNHCKFCRFLKCKATGMMNKWVVSAYKIKDARNKNSLTTSSKKDNKRSNDQENDLSRVENCSKMITYKYDIDSTPKLIEEMNTKYMLSNDIDKTVIDELGSALCSGKQHDLVTKISALELMLKQQVPLIAISLDDFVQLNSAIKIHLMRKNSDALVKLCIIQTLFNHILLQPSMENFNVSILQSLFLPKNEAYGLRLLESRGHSEKAVARILRKINEFFSGGSSIFMFLFTTILFHSTEDEFAPQVSELELKMMQKLERYLLHYFKGDIEKTAIGLGKNLEIIQLLRAL